MNKHALLVLVLLLAVSLAACGQGADTAPIAEDVEMSLEIEPSPPSIGEATLYITLHAADGNPIDGASMQVVGNMDHEGMMPVSGEGDSRAGGVYSVPFAWSMGGVWLVDVTATLPDGGIVTNRFEINVAAVSQDSIIMTHGESTEEPDATEESE